MLSPAECYRILGVKQSASEEEIHQAFKQVALQHHPDRQPDNPESERLFCAATEAYVALKRRISATPPVVTPEETPDLKPAEPGPRYTPMPVGQNRKRLPMPTPTTVRCILCIVCQSIAVAFIWLSFANENQAYGLAGVTLILAALAALTWNVMTSTVVHERKKNR